MAKVHGVAGEWARVTGTVMGMWPLFIGIFAAGFAAALMVFIPYWGAPLLALALAYCGWTLRQGLRHVERFFKGARGEERVSAILLGLPDSYHVFNDFVAGSMHVDHVVVGPAGVFAIETKFWKGRVTVEEGCILVDGQLPDRSPLAQVTKEAAAVKSRLAELGWTGAVTPVLAFASDTFEAKIAELRGTVILNANHLRASFDTDRVAIPPAECERLVRLMDDNA